MTAAFLVLSAGRLNLFPVKGARRTTPTAAAVAAKQRLLVDALAAAAWLPDGPASAWFYDPPWTLPWLRRNEVSVPVVARTR